MLVEKNNITDLLPQRDPIVMIDSLISQNETTTVTTFEVLASNIFIRDNELQEGGILENIAQSAAARAGYFYKLRNQTPPMGFIGAITKVLIERYPTIGETLRTSIEMKSEVFNITLIKGTTYIDNEQIAECEMKIVIDDSKKS